MDSAANLLETPTTWGRLAAARRSLEWAAAEPERLRHSPYLGSNCARLLDEVIAAWPADQQLPDALPQATGALRALDAQPAEQRHTSLAELIRLLDALIPLGQVGATLLPLTPRVRLIRPRHEPLKDEPSPERAPPPAEPSTDAPAEVAAPDRGEEPAPAPEPEPVAPAPPPAEPSLEELFAMARAETSSSPRARKPSPVEEPAPLLPFLHPERAELPLRELPGLDAELIDALADQGIETVGELLQVPPVRHHRVPLFDGTSVEPGEQMVRGHVRSRCLRLSPGLRRFEVQLELREHRRVIARWIGEPPRGYAGWVVGTEIGLVGMVELDVDHDGAPGDEGGAVALMLQAEPVGLDGRGSGLLSVYELPGIEDSRVRHAMALALGVILGRIRDPLPGAILESQRLLVLDEALRDAHFPANTTRRGISRLAFEELFLLQLGLATRNASGRPVRGIAHKILHGLLGQLDLQHGLRLDDGQELALAEIRRDLLRPRPMTRLLQGEVGAGKGLVALATAIIVAQGRSQVAMVCPDPQTAERRFLFAEPILRSLGISCLFAGEGLSHAGADAVRRGEALVVYGTGALLGERVEWKRLGLVVGEERDRYGTISPASLVGRNPRPDLLVLTAAPIPASLALTVFGEFELSIVPPRRTSRAVPRIFSGAERVEAYRLVSEQVQRGFQAMIVFPVGAGRDRLDLDDARRFVDAIGQELLVGARMAIYSSAMPREERLRVFDDFAHRRVDVLVCTTWIEDAPAVDNVSVMVVEHADLHSLIRLYRLRGHLRSGTCAMVMGDAPSPEGARRVRLAAESSDGFHLAELDLVDRGVQEVLGDRATEAPRFLWADPTEDRAVLLRARAEAFALARDEAELRRHKALAAAVQLRWGDWLGEEPRPGAPEEPAGGERAGGRRRKRRRRR